MKLKAKFDRLSFTANEAIISFVTADKWGAGQVAETMAKTAQGEDMPLTVEVRPYKSKRSVQQNRLMWEMLDLLSEKVNGKRDSEAVWQTYIIMLERFGAKYEYLMALPEAEKMLKEQFRASVKIEEREYNGKVMNIYKCYYGSSKFNTKEMTEFINSIQEELRELGVDYGTEQ
jgi:hypothetical protein